ncbi:helix-turn-helix domain-containing protein [Lysinibacillus odysseyi]|uniref:HTH araC/xylS-type domain-containing protein n=1 Tax=Lysinibacillus odysseyi 34hs-1 = NBRC 100172 TaxID=1220589 RepID=A0A0A3JFR7_9BACI|nr:AraC family transcriptional regulator [Lysinibacillus odysseyi]KGR85857.1 hypothetical protein CD32_08425 [Lysinibacillus odysseyi 34hs-1 = NBRC 100172]
MELSINQVIEYYASSSIQFVNAFTNRMEAGEKDCGRKTARDVCGLVIPLIGRAHFSFNGSVYKMNRQMIVHAGSSMNIEIESLSSPWEYAVIHYRLINTPEPYREMLHRHFSLSVNDSNHIQQMALQLLQQQAKPDSMSKLHTQVMFFHLLEQILIAARNDCYENQNSITAALEYIHQHYTEELLISELARKFGMERRRFSQSFEKLTGLTPIQYLTEYRLGKAKELLRTSSFPMAKIAEQTGYLDSFYFSRVFKKHFGMPPSTYRSTYKKNPYFEEE